MNPVLRTVFLSVVGIIITETAFIETALAEDNMRVFIGTYTGPKSQGIYTAKFDSGKGLLTSPELAAKATNPSFLALHPNGNILYAVAETADGPKASGAVVAYKIDRGTGKLTLLNEQPSGGGSPCHVSVDSKGRCVMVANYGTGSVATYPLSPDSSLGPAATVIQHHGSSVNPQRQQGPHAHFVEADEANQFALACDLGLDKV